MDYKLVRLGRLVVPDSVKRFAYRLLRKLRRKKAAKTARAVSRQEIVRSLRSLGVREGDTLLAQTALSSIGVVEGGPAGLIEAFKEAVGSGGTLLVPTFNPAPESVHEKGFAFDARNTPTNVGAVAETFRKMPGVTRSLHPTHSIAAWGRKAAHFTSGHEESDTGFGEETPYGRLVRDGGKILLIGNNNNSLVHFIELQAGFPLTHEKGSMKVDVTDHDGKLKTVNLKLHTKGERLVILEDSTPERRDYVLCQDYLVIPYPERRDEIKALGFLKHDSQFLREREHSLELSGAVSFGKVGDAPACLIDVKPYYSVVLEDFRKNVEKNRREYDEMASKSGNWNEIQWYYLVLKNGWVLSTIKAWRRLFRITR